MFAGLWSLVVVDSPTTLLTAVGGVVAWSPVLDAIPRVLLLRLVSGDGDGSTTRLCNSGLLLLPFLKRRLLRSPLLHRFPWKTTAASFRQHHCDLEFRVVIGASSSKDEQAATAGVGCRSRRTSDAVWSGMVGTTLVDKGINWVSIEIGNSSQEVVPQCKLVGCRYDPARENWQYRDDMTSPKITSRTHYHCLCPVILGVGCSSSYLLLSASFSLARYIIEKEKLGKDPSLADLYQHTHKRKNGDGAYVCAKAQKVLDTMNELRQTQTEASDVELWLEAIGGVKRGGYVYGFGSDTQHYFPEASKKSKSQAGASSSNAALMAEIQEMREENKMFREENKFIREELSKMGAIFAQLSANPEFLSSFNLNNSGSQNDETQAYSDED
nr:putative transposase En/Spm [Ipomoea batatas]